MQNHSQPETTPTPKNGKVEIKSSFDLSKPFWQRIAEIGEQVPKEEWEKLPKDFARNFEHYLYGAPKEEWGKSF